MGRLFSTQLYIFGYEKTFRTNKDININFNIRKTKQKNILKNIRSFEEILFTQLLSRTFYQQFGML